DVIVVVTAAETVIHGGPAALLGASGRETLRAAGAYSLLETSASQGWQLAVAIERELSRRVPVIGAIVIGIPRTTPFLPRERPNPLLAAYLALGLALRMWRDGFPLVEGGTAILLHRFHRHFAHPTQQPYRAFFQATTRLGRESVELMEAERAAVEDPRAIEAYRGRRSCHPLLPFADWSSCAPALGRLGAVIVAGCRDA